MTNNSGRNARSHGQQGGPSREDTKKLEGATVPAELQGWNYKTGKVSRDRRGGDSIYLAGFWNGLEEFMAVHKQELFN